MSGSSQKPTAPVFTFESLIFISSGEATSFSPKQSLAVNGSLGISDHVFASLIPLKSCFQMENMTFFIPNQEIIVAVRLNHTL